MNKILPEYRYGMDARPPAPGATPRGHTSVEESADYRHGVLVMPHKLSDEELSQYELKLIPGETYEKEK